MVPIKCYDVLEPVLNETTERFGAVWKQNEAYTKILQQYCSAIDGFLEEFNAYGVSAEVCEEDLTIHITMESDDMVIENKKHLFYQIMVRSIAVRFRPSEDNNLEVEFVFPSIWEKA